MPAKTCPRCATVQKKKQGHQEEEKGEGKRAKREAKSGQEIREAQPLERRMGPVESPVQLSFIPNIVPCRCWVQVR